MFKESICNRERNQINKMNKFQLGYPFKKIGLYVSVLAFILMIANKFIETPIWLKPVLKGILLIGLLLISLAKEKMEDEFLESLRSQSYRLAFILGIVYTLIQPIVNFVVGYLLNENEEFIPFDYFQILFFMLIVQLMFFRLLKRMNS